MNLKKQILTELEIENSFTIQRVENLTSETLHPKRLIFNRIILIEDGSGNMIVDGTFYRLNQKNVFLIAKGQILQFEKSSTYSGYNLVFGDCFWEKTPKSASNCKAVLFNNISANQLLELNESELNEFSSLLNILLKEYLSDDYINKMDALAAYLKIIMIKLANVKMTDEAAFNSQDYMAYRSFMDLISAEFHVCHSVNKYAEKLNLTARRLSELCKRCSGLNAKEIINGQLLSEAKRSLQFGSSPVKEIAYNLNFNTPEEFSHFFKKYVKISPLEYRNQYLNLGK